MPIYKQTTEITNIDDLLSSVERDIEEVYFGDKQVFTVWGEYDGTLPATYSANGDYLADYHIYGAAGGVGDRTENLFDGEMESGYYDNNGEKQSNANWIRCKRLVNANSNATYHAIIDNPGETTGSVVFARCYNARGEYIGTTSQTVIQYYKEYAFTTLNDTKFISFYVSVSYINAKLAIYQTTISHEPYVPYGYEVDMSVRSANLLNWGDVQDNRDLNFTTGIPEVYAGRIATVNPIDVSSYTDVTVSFDGDQRIRAMVSYFTADNTLILRRTSLDSGASIDVSSAAYMYVCFYDAYLDPISKESVSNAMLNEGSTPLPYQPYSNTTTPIYIGSDPLGEDEYVDYAAGKVYRRTEQLFNAETAVYKNGVFKNDNGVESTYPGAGYYETYIPITPGETIYVTDVYGSENLTVRLYFYDAQKRWIWRTDGHTGAFSVVTPSFALYAQLQISQEYIPSPNTITITQGTVAPSTYIPYLQPEDPPVPLPALPTVDGTNIVDYAGQSAAPSRFYAKYRKEGF